MKPGGLLLAMAMAAVAASLEAQPVCSAPTERLMSWPAENPVWQFCWLRATQSSGVNGSGLEIRNVYYKGHLVLKRGHVPILNVQYDAAGGGCGGANRCYRDYMDVERSYLSDNVCPPPLSGTTCGYSEPSCPPLTVCELHQGVDVCTTLPAECPQACFSGVSAEKLADRLVMTTQTRAGWYRYEMKWTFFLDGRLQPYFGYTAVANNCVNFSHRHNAYWRLDFDLDGPADDRIYETTKPSGRGGTQLRTEVMRGNTNPNMTWVIRDRLSDRGYRLFPGHETEYPVDTFAVGDLWLLNYKSTEIDDVGQSGPACAIKIGNFLNGESLNDDVVVWYRTGAAHAGGDLDDCHIVGPMLEPVGNWSP
jgi:hypothetical protein